MRKIIFKIFLILIVGGIGGILIDRAFFPYLAQFKFFEEIKFISDGKNITQIINKTEEVIIKENEALEDAIQRVWITVGAVLQKDKKGNILNQFSAFVLTDDGLILTSGEAAQNVLGLYFLTRENKELPLEVLKQDKKLNLAIFKASNYNFSTVSLGEFEKIKLGQQVFLVGAKSELGFFKNFVNAGLIKSIDDNGIALSFFEEKFASGAPIFNIKGEMIGINLVGADGAIKVVPINKIREFIK